MILNEEYVRLGSNCKIDENALVGYMSSRKINDLELIIEDGAIIRSGTVVYLGSKIGCNFETGYNVVVREENLLGDRVKIWSNTIEKYPTGIFDPERIKGPTIKRGAKIGIGAIIMPGVVIGENSVIGAGSLVIRDIPPNVIAYGIPAKVVKSVSDLTDYD